MKTYMFLVWIRITAEINLKAGLQKQSSRH